MPTKANKHRTKTTFSLPTKASCSSKLVIKFYRASRKHCWRAWRGGRLVAQAPESYVKKDKMKRTFLRMVESLREGNWRLE
jgi:hypothetical protein